MPGVTRKRTRLSDDADEVNQARIWCGVHYRNSTEVGTAMGRAIGEIALRERLVASH